MSYCTVLHEGRGEYEEKKSVFYGVALPVKSEEDAIALINGEKKRYPDARHHVYAYVLEANNTARYNEDHEPQGTAAIPILDMIKKSGLSDVCVVVTRYFGGTLLGTGGLVRAYTAAAKAAVENAVPAEGIEAVCFSLTMTYADYDKVLSFFEKEDVTVTDTDFGSDVTVKAKILSEKYDDLVSSLSDKSAGRLTPERIGDVTDLQPKNDF